MQTSALWGYLDPLSAVLMAALFRGEKLSSVEIAGAALILGDTLLGESGRLKAASPVSPIER